MSNEERLENISPIGFDQEGNVLVNGQDYHFLLEQAEKAQELDNRIQNKILPEIENGYEQNMRFRGALESIRDTSILPAFQSWGYVYGIARKALEESK